MVLSGSKLWDVQQSYQMADDSYKYLTFKVRPEGRPVFTEPQTSAKSVNESVTVPETEPAIDSGTQILGRMPDVAIPDMEIDFDVLRSINPDAVAWLYNPDTVIDYPVVRATDYAYYLHHLPDGTYNNNGTLFIDYNWNDFSDKLTIIYGHNMKSGKMFASITNYKKQSYFNDHPYLYLYTHEDERYRIDLIYGCVIGAGQWRERAFMFDVNMDELLVYAAHHTTFRSPVSYTPGDRIVVLSTCSYEFDDARYVVLGVLRPEFSD